MFFLLKIQKNILITQSVRRSSRTMSSSFFFCSFYLYCFCLYLYNLLSSMLFYTRMLSRILHHFSFFVLLLFNRQILSFWRWLLVLRSMIYSRGTSSFDLGRNLLYKVVPRTQSFFLFEMVTISLIRWNYKRMPINWITKYSFIDNKRN